MLSFRKSKIYIVFAHSIISVIKSHAELLYFEVMQNCTKHTHTQTHTHNTDTSHTHII